jgi:hypothetical protein
MRPEKTSCVVLLATLFWPLGALAQTTAGDPRSLDERLTYFQIPEIIARAPGERTDRLNDLADVLGTHTFAFVYYALPPGAVGDSFKEFLQSAERTRVDRQIGSSLEGGSTSTVSRTGLAPLFAFALESGAVTQTVDQNVATVRANADGLIRFLSNREVIPGCAQNDPACDAPGPLKNLELSASLNVSGSGTNTLGGTTPGTNNSVDFAALINQRQFASATARYAVMNNRDPRSNAYRMKWLAWFQTNQAALSSAGADLVAYVAAVLKKVQTTDENDRTVVDINPANTYARWLADTRARLQSAPPTAADWQNVLHRQLTLLVDKMRALDPDFGARLADLSQAYVRYLALRRDLVSTLVTDPGLTLEYTFAEPAVQPKLHTVKVAYAFSPQGATGEPNPGTMTFNAALDYFQDPQPTGAQQNTSRWKDAQASVQFDRPLGPADSSARLSIGAFYQYQIHPGIITIPSGATTLPGASVPLPSIGSRLLAPPGSIYSAQAVLTIRLAGSGIEIPIGISWSNRTDLVSGNEVRGHIGLTFDSTPLLLMPSSK